MLIPLTLDNLEMGLTVTLRPEDQTHGAYSKFFGRKGKIVAINPQRGNSALLVQIKFNPLDETHFGNESYYAVATMFYYRLLICEGDFSLEEVKRTAIERKIKMLHTRQLFYLANKEFLPSWG